MACLTCSNITVPIMKTRLRIARKLPRIKKILHSPSFLLRKTGFFIIGALLILFLVLSFFYISTLLINISNEDSLKKQIASCNATYNGQEITCWTDVITDIIKKDGLHNAFFTISGRFVEQPSFKRHCNQILHDVGHWTYHYTTHNNVKFVMPPNVTMCASGFDRAFVHAMVASTGDIEKAIAFCRHPQLAAESADATARCYHDVGHGAFDIYAPQIPKEGQQPMLDKALKKCEEVSKTPLELDYCTGGVFSEVIEFYQENKYGVKLDTEDPFSLCREQAEKYKTMCYYTAKPLLLWLTHGDFIKAASLIETIEKDEYASGAMDALATSVALGNITNGVRIEDYDKNVLDCRTLQGRLHNPCISGLAIELLTHSSADDALSFCRLRILTGEERDACFLRIVPNLAEWVPKDRIKEVCESIEISYREFCRIP